MGLWDDRNRVHCAFFVCLLFVFHDRTRVYRGCVSHAWACGTTAIVCIVRFLSVYFGFSRPHACVSWVCFTRMGLWDDRTRVHCAFFVCLLWFCTTALVCIVRFLSVYFGSSRPHASVSWVCSTRMGLWEYRNRVHCAFFVCLLWFFTTARVCIVGVFRRFSGRESHHTNAHCALPFFNCRSACSSPIIFVTRAPICHSYNNNKKKCPHAGDAALDYCCESGRLEGGALHSSTAGAPTLKRSQA